MLSACRGSNISSCHWLSGCFCCCCFCFCCWPDPASPGSKGGSCCSPCSSKPGPRPPTMSGHYGSTQPKVRKPIKLSQRPGIPTGKIGALLVVVAALQKKASKRPSPRQPQARHVRCQVVQGWKMPFDAWALCTGGANRTSAGHDTSLLESLVVLVSHASHTEFFQLKLRN